MREAIRIWGLKGPREAQGKGPREPCLPRKPKANQGGLGKLKERSSGKILANILRN